MRLDFKILWVEDQPQAIAEDRVYLEAELRDFGFKPIVEPITGFDKVQELLARDPQDDEFDLILVDFDLGHSGGNGGDAARAIRDKFPHREMVFYSGKSPDDLRAVAAEKKIDGVYFAHRPELADDVFSVIENMLRKVVDLSHTRGIIMAETSELDHCLELCLSSSFEDLDIDRQKSFHNKIVEAIRERYKDQQKKLETLAHLEKFSELLGESHIMTSFDKTRAILRFLNSYTQIPDKRIHHAAVSDYQDNFQGVRNVLAHGMVTTKDGHKVFKGQNDELNEERMREWRISLMDHRDQIKAVATALNVSFEDE